MEEYTKKCVIVGAGDFQKESIIKENVLALYKDDFCIAADGGLIYLEQLGIVPDMLIGDMDSLGAVTLPEQVCIKKLPVEKNDTDMLAAIKEGLERGYQSFELYGALGGRFDHTLANIQCLDYLNNRGARGVLFGNHLRVELLCNDRIDYPASMYRGNRRISVFAYGGDAYGVTEKGLKYSLENAHVRQEFPIGVSNEFTGQESMIEVKKGKLLICVGDFS